MQLRAWSSRNTPGSSPFPLRAQIAFWVQAKDAAACMGLSRFVFLRRARLRAKGLPARSSFALAKCRMLMNAKDFTQIEVAYIQMQKADPDFRRPKRYYC